MMFVIFYIYYRRQSHLGNIVECRQVKKYPPGPHPPLGRLGGGGGGYNILNIPSSLPVGLNLGPCRAALTDGKYKNSGDKLARYPFLYICSAQSGQFFFRLSRYIPYFCKHLFIEKFPIYFPENQRPNS
jgi:hypothetical protein